MIPKEKKHEVIIFDEAMPFNMNRVKDLFVLSPGNKQVLELIPSMMEDPEYRTKLRGLAIAFLFKDNKKKVQSK